MPRLCLLFVVGMLVGYILRLVVPCHWWLGLLVVMSVVALILRHASTVTLLLYSAVFSLGAFLFSFSIERLGDEVGERCETVRLLTCPRLSKSGKVYLMDGVTPKGTLLQVSLLRDSDGAAGDLCIGDVLAVEGKILPIEQSQWTISHGYGGRLFLLPQGWKKMKNVGPDLTFMERLQRGRKELLSAFRHDEIGDDEYAVLSAMTLGDKAFISTELKDAYSKTGASHVLALSGMHLAVIFAIVMFLFSHILLGMDRVAFHYVSKGKVSSVTNYLLEHHPEPYVYVNFATILCGFFIWSYVFLVGAMPSVVRAASMLTIYAFLRLFNRQAHGLNVLCITAFIMLLVNPLSLFDIGFQMSFLAVLGITLFYSKISNFYTLEFYEKGMRRLLKWLWNGISLALSAQLFVLPLIAFYFQRIAVCAIFLSPVISFMAVIVVGGAIVFLFVTLLAHCIFLPSFLISWFASALSFLVGCQNAMLQWLSSLPFSYVDGISLSLPQLVLVYIIMVSVIIIINRGTAKE